MSGSGAGTDRSALSSLPQVDTVLRLPAAQAAITQFGRKALRDAVRATMDTARTQIRDGHAAPTADRALAAAVERLDRGRRQRLTRMINATGVVLHTNLGRAPLSDASLEAVTEAAGYTNVEYDLETGARGSRTRHLGELTASLCGTESATVVNNGAAALLLVLGALATDREVIVSRGELIEIGGSYRLPDVMAVSGARTVEVGTTNRTRVADYRNAVGDDTGLLLKVHRSNFGIIGFTEEAGAEELAQLADSATVPFVYDLGSGLLRDVDAGPLADEVSVEYAVRAGADLVIFSGDKLLGGPQAGIIAGRANLVRRCTQHPLARAVRVDKLQRAALEATLAAHLRSEVPLDVPTVAMLAVDPAELTTRATAVASSIDETLTPGPGTSRTKADVVDLRAVVGGGALPGTELPSAGLALTVHDPVRLAARLREGAPPVITRIEDDRVVLDLRTVAPSEDALLASLIVAALT